MRLPHRDYDKVESLSAQSEGGTDITIRLVPKPGQQFDKCEVGACLRHTVAKTEGDLTRWKFVAH